MQRVKVKKAPAVDMRKLSGVEQTLWDQPFQAELRRQKQTLRRLPVHEFDEHGWISLFPSTKQIPFLISVWIFFQSPCRSWALICRRRESRATSGGAVSLFDASSPVVFFVCSRPSMSNSGSRRLWRYYAQSAPKSDRSHEKLPAHNAGMRGAASGRKGRGKGRGLG